MAVRPWVQQWRSWASLLRTFSAFELTPWRGAGAVLFFTGPPRAAVFAHEEVFP